MVGEVDGGWRLARTTLANERVAMGSASSLGDAVERLVDLRPAARRRAGRGVGAWKRLGALVAQGSGLLLLDLRATLRQLDGRDPGAESSVRKLVGVRHRQEVAEAALELIPGSAGRRAAVGGTSCRALARCMQTRCLTIAGGTTQVLLTVAGGADSRVYRAGSSPPPGRRGLTHSRKRSTPRTTCALRIEGKMSNACWAPLHLGIGDRVRPRPRAASRRTRAPRPPARACRSCRGARRTAARPAR